VSSLSDEKTVCFVCHPYLDRKETGRGHDRYAAELIHALRALNTHCTVMHSGYIANIWQGMAAETVFPFRMVGIQASIFHATATVCARVPIWLRKKPLVTTIHDCIPLHYKNEYDTSLKYRYKSYCLGLAARHSDALIVPFELNRQILHDRFKVPYERIFPIQYGIDTGRFYSDPTVKKVPGRILFIGEAVRAKGVDTLIEAMPRIVATVPGAHVWIGSGGKELDVLKNHAMSKNLANHIKFLGYINEDNLSHLYREAEVFVFPSRYGMGLSTGEAMACGTATVSGNALDTRDAYGDNTWLVDPDDPNDLADAVIQLLVNNDLRNDYIGRGMALMGKRTWAMMADEIIDLYTSLF